MTMNERIHNLLTLCMEAQEKGCNVDIDITRTMISVFNYKIPPTYITKAYHIFIKSTNVESQFVDAENYLKEVIANAST
jgi:hypothetical protein